ncbi:helix-turn-helix domain-containing protein [Streptomyces albogriseolus]|uniref:helix-turn-helix domain-containing protein n=1 Tax=Streptomyces albogriseolus TaxID=1887 RepID=UPI0037ACD856
MLDQPQIGRRPRRLRAARGLSQADVVGDGMSTGHLSRLESGERRPTERTVAHLARRLGVDASALTGPTDGRSLTAVLASVASAPAGSGGTEVLGRAVEEDPGEDPAARRQALWLLSRDAGRDGDYELERVRLLELLKLSRVLEAPDLRARSLVRTPAAPMPWAMPTTRNRRPWRHCPWPARRSWACPTPWPPSRC